MDHKVEQSFKGSFRTYWRVVGDGALFGTQGEAKQRALELAIVWIPLVRGGYEMHVDHCAIIEPVHMKLGHAEELGC